jgi:hypothetical protein
MKRIEIAPIEANSWHLFSEVLERLYGAPQLIQSVPKTKQRTTYSSRETLESLRTSDLLALSTSKEQAVSTDIS